MTTGEDNDIDRLLNQQLCFHAWLYHNRQVMQMQYLSFGVLLHSPLSCEPDTKILKLLHLGQQLLPEL